MPATTGDREIDLVLEQNNEPRLRELHTGYGDVLTVLGATARNFARIGLTARAAALRDLRKRLDSEWANDMRAEAARSL